MNMSEKKFDYTKAVAELDEIAAESQDPATSLDDIGALVKRSKELIEACRKYLRTVRKLHGKNSANNLRLLNLPNTPPL